MAYTKVKSAWQNESGMYAVKTQFSDEVPKMLTQEDLDKLIELMPDYNWFVVTNPIYQEPDLYRNQLNRSS